MISQNFSEKYKYFTWLIKAVFVLFAALCVFSCGGGGGMVAFSDKDQLHNGGGAGGFGTGNQTGNGFDPQGQSIEESEAGLLISQMAALPGITTVTIELTINGTSYPAIEADETTTTAVLPEINPGDKVSGKATINVMDGEPRVAYLDETEATLHGVLKFKVPYKYEAYNLGGMKVAEGTYYARDGINLDSCTDANIGGWKCNLDGVVHYGSYVTGVRGDIRLDAVLQAGAGFTATPGKSWLTADGTCTDSTTITITGGTGPFTVVSGDTSILQCTDLGNNVWNVTFVSVAGGGEKWFVDDQQVQILITDTATNANKPVLFTLKNKYSYTLLAPDDSNCGGASGADAGTSFDLATLASNVASSWPVPAGRTIVAFKDTSSGGNTYKTTDTVTLNSSNFTSRNITLQAKLNFTATISDGDTTISGQDGTYANPYHLKLGGTATEQKINIGITDKVGDIRIRAGTTGYVGVTGSGTSFAAEILSTLAPDSAPSPLILLKIIDVVPGTATTTEAESNSANVYATKDVYVQIDRPTLTVTFNANGGTNAPASVSVLYGNKISAPTTSPSKNGATFGGWYTSNDDGATLSATQFNFTSTSITSNLTLYAKWNEITHTVTYNNSGCSQLDISTISDSYKTFTESAGLASLPNPTLPTGYTLEGWYNNSGFTGAKVTSIHANTTTNQVLYAKINVDVTVDVRGTTNTVQVVYGNGLAASSLTSYAPTNLKHWSSVSRTGTIAFMFNLSNITEPITLYAVIESNITYCYTTTSDIVPNTKIASENWKYIEGEGRSSLPSVACPFAPGTMATFDGWYTDTARTTKVTSISDTQTGNVTLYARYSVSPGGTNVLSIRKSDLNALSGNYVTITDKSVEYRINPATDITDADFATFVNTLKALDIYFGIAGGGGFTTFPTDGFSGCTKLRSITLPATSGFTMSTAAFRGSGLSSVTMGQTHWTLNTSSTSQAYLYPSDIDGSTYGDSKIWTKD
ncbi:MAG: InlB B-repeat-containing protein [Spirochaetaceae bacterium]|nr:InlB B-repeat-containing protein [Spirochaetaceae bacterium]